jgi:hypothetical protein
VSNAYGCTDTAYGSFELYYPVFDLSLMDIESSYEDNEITLTLSLANFGTSPITEIELETEFNDGFKFTEQWEGQLNSGNLQVYTMKTSRYSEELPGYVCITADISGSGQDINPGDNSQCLTLNKEFKLLTPTPNPAYNEVYISFIAPFEDEALIEVFDNNGTKVGTIYDNVCPEGLTRLRLNLNAFRPGPYHVRITYRDQVQVTSFLKLE